MTSLFFSLQLSYIIKMDTNIHGHKKLITAI